MQIQPKVHRIEVANPNIVTLYQVCIYLVGDKEMVLIDSGYNDKKSIASILDEFKALGDRKLTHILITHCHLDHYGGAAAIKKATGAIVAAHKENAPLVNEEAGQELIDLSVGDGHIIDLAGTKLQIIHTPGHSPGDICVYMQDEGVLFTGDTIVGTGTVVVDGDMVQYMESLHRLMTFNAKLICPGHGPLVEKPNEKIQEVIDHRNMREEQILAQLATGKKTSWEMVLTIYADVDKRLHRLADRNVRGHLTKLIQEGRVKETKIPGKMQRARRSRRANTRWFNRGLGVYSLFLPRWRLECLLPFLTAVGRWLG